MHQIKETIEADAEEGAEACHQQVGEGRGLEDGGTVCPAGVQGPLPEEGPVSLAQQHQLHQYKISHQHSNQWLFQSR